MANQLIAPSKIEGLGLLAQNIGQVQDLSNNWKSRLRRIRIPMYKKEVLEFTRSLDNTSKDCEQVMVRAAELAQTGVDLVGDTVDLMKELSSGKPTTEIQQLQANLLSKIDNAAAAAELLKGDLNDVGDKLSLTGEVVPGRSNVLVPMETKLLVTVVCVLGLVFPPMATRAREFRDITDPRKRLSTASDATGVLNGIKARFDHAIEVLGTLMDFWSGLAGTIRATPPHELLGNSHGALGECLGRWTEIQNQYGNYASKASFSRQSLEVKREIPTSNLNRFATR